MAEKVAARAFAQSYLSDLVPTVFDSLVKNGYFYDKVEQELEQEFLPWLTEQTQSHLDRLSTARNLLDSML